MTRLAEDLLQTARLPGLSVAILNEGRVVYAQGFGYGDLDRLEPVRPPTRFRAASVSKMITITAVAKLVQEGRLPLDGPVHAYAPAWPSEPSITPRMLSGHLSGIAHYQAQDRIERQRQYGSVTEALQVFVRSPRAGQPGEAYVYSTHGYTLLSAVVEGASGQPFLDYLSDELFASLGMTGSGPDLRADPPPGMSTLYGRRNGEPVRIPTPENPSYKWGSGGLVSTPTDLVRLADAYLNGFLRRELVAEMFTSQRTSDGEETGVGIGWRIGEDDRGRRVVHHSGAMGGARSTIVLYPDEYVAVAVMINVVWPSNIRQTAQLFRDAYEAPDPIPTVGPRTSGEVAYAGTFAGEPATGTLRLDGGSGWITMPEPYTVWAEEYAVERLPIRQLYDDQYLLVSPFGLVPLTLRLEADGLHGHAQPSPSRAWEFIAPLKGDGRA